jgi:hypothetical protein
MATTAIGITTLTPQQTFEDNMRPAQLLLRVYRLLDSNDNILDAGKLVEALRQIVGASADEDLMLIYNELFLGLVRERAQMPRSTLRQATLCHLLRQSVVASCTALETYLPALLLANLPVMIRAQRRDFVPRGDQTLKEYFSDLQFSLDETLRLLGDKNAAQYISGKILGLANFKYLSSKKGIHVVGMLLGLTAPEPWEAIAAHLNRDKRELMKTFKDTVDRRNDIVHRADRCQSDSGGDAQTITYAWTQQAVDTIKHVCLALEELVTARVAEMQAMLGE